MEFINKTLAWIRANMLLSVLFGIIVLIVLFPKLLVAIIGAPRRRKRRRTVGRGPVGRSGRRVIRSAGMRKASGKGYAARGGGTIPFKYNKDGSVKKAWQVAGTVAAHSRMSRLRRR